MDKSGKYWGTTSRLFHFNNVECHLIEVSPGGYCSIHKHHSKFNRFIVLQGELSVRTWKAGDDVSADIVTLGPGEETTVPPGYSHQFENLGEEVVKALEVYWVSLSENDIERSSIGGSGC